MRPLIWHWGRFGAGPLFAARLAEGFAALPDGDPVLSLAAGAELLRAGQAGCAWAEPTYQSAAGYALQRLAAPLAARRVRRRLAALAPDVAICAMPALLDPRMARALRRADIPYAVVVHDATAHPGDGLGFRLLGQRRLLRGAAVLFTLSGHVAAELRAQGFGSAGQRVARLWLPPFNLRQVPPAFSHDGPPRLLCFGRIRPYKGLDLLADALGGFGRKLPFELRVCGDGPALPELDRLRALGARVELRWIPEAELSELIGWADVVVLPYREASQSGAAAAAIGQGRSVVATRVGGLAEQLAGWPGAILCEPDAASLFAALQRIRPVALPAPDPAGSWRELAAAMRAALPARPAA